MMENRFLRILVSLLTIIILATSASCIGYADAMSLPSTTDELLDLSNKLLQKLCNIDEAVRPLGLGTYHCPEDIRPGSYTIYVFSNHKAAYYNTGLTFSDSSGNKSTFQVGNLSMGAIKVTVTDGGEFSLYQDDDHFGVMCFIAPLRRIGE